MTAAPEINMDGILEYLEAIYAFVIEQFRFIAIAFNGEAFLRDLKHLLAFQNRFRGYRAHMIGTGNTRNHQITKSGGVDNKLVCGPVRGCDEGDPGRSQPRQPVQKPQVIDMNHIGLQPKNQFSHQVAEYCQKIQQLLLGPITVSKHLIWHDNRHSGNRRFHCARPGLFSWRCEQTGKNPFIGNPADI